MITTSPAKNSAVCPMCDADEEEGDVQTFNDLYLCVCGYQWPQRADYLTVPVVADKTPRNRALRAVIFAPISAGAPG